MKEMKVAGEMQVEYFFIRQEILNRDFGTLHLLTQAMILPQQGELYTIE